MTSRERMESLDALLISNRLFHNDVSANLVLLGAAYQSGALPLPGAAIEEAIQRNGVAVHENVQAFRRGRQAVSDPDGLAEVLAPGAATPSLSPADLALIDRFRSGASTWLSVGRLAPNKGHLELVDAFAAYKRIHDAHARLVIVGRADPRLSSYTGAVHARIDQLGIADAVHFLSDVSDGELKSAYLVADALVSLSEHEGFCVPLAEAMALGTPVVGYAAGAVASTAGDAALLWDESDPYLFAASVARIRDDASLRQLLRERGLARIEDSFSTGALVRTLAEVMERFA